MEESVVEFPWRIVVATLLVVFIALSLLSMFSVEVQAALVQGAFLVGIALWVTSAQERMRREAARPVDEALQRSQGEVEFRRWTRQRLFEHEVEAVVGFQDAAGTLLFGQLERLDRRSWDADELKEHGERRLSLDLDDAMAELFEAWSALVLHTERLGPLVQAATRFLDSARVTVDAVEGPLGQVETFADLAAEAWQDEDLMSERRWKKAADAVGRHAREVVTVLGDHADMNAEAWLEYSALAAAYGARVLDGETLDLAPADLTSIVHILESSGEPVDG